MAVRIREFLATAPLELDDPAVAFLGRRPAHLSFTARARVPTWQKAATAHAIAETLHAATLGAYYTGRATDFVRWVARARSIPRRTGTHRQSCIRVR